MKDYSEEQLERIGHSLEILANSSFEVDEVKQTLHKIEGHLAEIAALLRQQHNDELPKAPLVVASPDVAKSARSDVLAQFVTILVLVGGMTLAILFWHDHLASQHTLATAFRNSATTAIGPAPNAVMSQAVTNAVSMPQTSNPAVIVPPAVNTDTSATNTVAVPVEPVATIPATVDANSSTTKDAPSSTDSPSIQATLSTMENAPAPADSFTLGRALAGLAFFGIYGLVIYLYAKSRRDNPAKDEPGIIFWMVHFTIAFSIALGIAAPAPEQKELTIQQQEQEEKQKEDDEFRQQLLNISKDPKVLNKIDEDAKENDNSGKL
jgi:hypothetical protein